MLIKEQNFGVEIEMTGITREQAAQIIAEYYGTTSRYVGTYYRTYTAQDSKGRYVEVVLIGKDPNGAPTPYYYKLADIGTKCFYSAADAAQLAKQLTENYERIWGWLGAPDIPMRRPWQDLLPGKKGTEL